MKDRRQEFKRCVKRLGEVGRKIDWSVRLFFSMRIVRVSVWMDVDVYRNLRKGTISTSLQTENVSSLGVNVRHRLRRVKDFLKRGKDSRSRGLSTSL